jgi:plastocyanin
MKKILILLLVAALFLVVSGCTDSPPEAPPTPVPTKTKAPSPTYLPTTTIPTPERTVSVNDNTITIKRGGFSPADITVKKGATVRWVNADSTEDPALYNPTHRIKIIQVYDGQLISPGKGWSWVFTKLGVYDYTDMIHPELHGTVTVE